MVDDGFLAGLAVGGILVGPPLILGTWLFSEVSYREGYEGKEIVFVFGLLGRTREGVFVFVPRFEEGRHDREVAIRVQESELRVRELERGMAQNEYEHLRLRKELEDLKKGMLTPEMRNKVEELISLLGSAKERRVNTKVPCYQSMIS